MGGPARPSVLIATPTHDGSLDCRHVAALVESVALLARAGIGHEIRYEVGNSLVADARNRLVAHFLAGRHGDLVFIDADIAWSPPDLLALLRHDAALVAGVYQRKSMAKLDFTVKFGPRIEADAQGLLEAERVGAGFLRLRRDGLERLVAARPELKLRDPRDPSNTTLYALFDGSIVDGEYIGEDYTFCDRWRAAGGRVLVDPRMRFTHIGSHGFDEPLMKHLKPR